MQEYLGQPCLICGDAFSEQDDVVTCPDCGTPYHRACYLRTGHCINTELHESGKSWMLTRRAAIAREKSAEKLAEQANQAAEREREGGSGAASLYDGVRLNPDDPCCGLDPAEEMDGVPMRDVAEFVSTNRFYYLPLFRLMKVTGRRISFNLICLFFPEFYFANRKMWGAAIVSMLLNLLLNLPASLVYMERYTGIVPPVDLSSALFSRIETVAGIGGLVFPVACCLLANHLYYRFAVRRIAKIRAESGESDVMYHHELQTAGGTSMVNVLILLLIEAVLAGVAAFVIMKLTGAF